MSVREGRAELFVGHPDFLRSTPSPREGGAPHKLASQSHVSSSSSFFASFRSTVSNPSVNQPYTGASTSRASVRRPCSPPPPPPGGRGPLADRLSPPAPMGSG